MLILVYILLKMKMILYIRCRIRIRKKRNGSGRPKINPDDNWSLKYTLRHYIRKEKRKISLLSTCESEFLSWGLQAYSLCYIQPLIYVICIREAANNKKVLFLVALPLKGGGIRAWPWPLRKRTYCGYPYYNNIFH